MRIAVQNVTAVAVANAMLRRLSGNNGLLSQKLRVVVKRHKITWTWISWKTCAWHIATRCMESCKISNHCWEMVCLPSTYTRTIYVCRQLQRHCCCVCMKYGRIKVWGREPGRGEETFYIHGISNALQVFNELSDVLCQGDFRAFRAARGTMWWCPLVIPHWCMFVRHEWNGY